MYRMGIEMNKYKFKIFLLAFGVAACISGCGGNSDEEKALAEFSQAISEFSDAIHEADENINGLDISDSGSVDELLQILDDLDSEFSRFAEIAVPEQYAGIESLADQASQNMSEAVSYYHSAFEAETFNQSDADVAYQYYGRAMQRVEYIGYILTGDEIPEDENVTVYEEDNDSRILDKWLNDYEDETDIEENSAE